MGTPENPFLGHIAACPKGTSCGALHSARSLAYPSDMSQSLCAVRLALHPEILNF